jgi:hypothetical protein
MGWHSFVGVATARPASGSGLVPHQPGMCVAARARAVAVDAGGSPAACATIAARLHHARSHAYGRRTIAGCELGVRCPMRQACPEQKTLIAGACVDALSLTPTITTVVFDRGRFDRGGQGSL